MASKPTVGGSDGTWGTELNAYLDVEHDSDGTHGAITPTSITATGRIKTSGFLSLGLPTELTISSGSVTPTQSRHSVDTEPPATTDNLDTIAGTNAVSGDLLLLEAENTGRTVVVRDASVSGGNIQLAGAVSCSLDNTSDTLLLYYGGVNWIEISRSDNG